jgi:hypothetical protein
MREETRKHLKRYNYQLLEDQSGDLRDTLGYFGLNIQDEDTSADNSDTDSYEDDDNDDEDEEEELLQQVAKKNNICIEVHTSSLDNPVIKYNEDCDTIIRIYKNDNEDSSESESSETETDSSKIETESSETDPCGQTYCPIVKKDGTKQNQATKDSIPKMNKQHRPNINVHTNDEIKVLWKIIGNITRDIRSCVIDCEVEQYNAVEIWKSKREQLHEYLDVHKKRPSSTSKNQQIKQLGCWILMQKHNYNKQGHEYSKHGMKNPEIHVLWTQTLSIYSNYLCIDNIQQWKNKREQLHKYMNSYNKRPSNKSKEPHIKQLGIWTTAQKKNYDEQGTEYSKKIMTNPEIHALWTQTMNDYLDYLCIDNVKEWKNKREQLHEYMDTQNKTPSLESKDPQIKLLSRWVSCQKKNYDEQGPKYSNFGMKKPEFHALWTQTLTDYSDYLCDNVQQWKNKREQLHEYMDTYKKTPSSASQEPQIKYLGTWNLRQQKNYDEQGTEYSKYIMKTPEIHALWTQTLNDYSDYLCIDNVQQWKNKREQLHEYMDTYKKTPSSASKDPQTKQLGIWVSVQKRHYDKQGTEYSKYIMTTPEIHALWTQTLTDYSEYLCIDDVQQWKTKREQIQEYMNIYKKRPSNKSKDRQIKQLGNWISTQNKNYNEEGPKQSKQIMSTPEIYLLWTQTLTDYTDYLCIDNVDDWKENNNKLQIYIDTYKKAPSAGSKDLQTKQLGRWAFAQKTNYNEQGTKDSKYIMKTPEIHALWTQTKADYSEYLCDNIQHWKNKNRELRMFIDIHKRIPYAGFKAPHKKQLGSWLRHQKENYDIQGPEYSKQIMSTPEIHLLWTQTLNDYADYFKSQNQTIKKQTKPKEPLIKQEEEQKEPTIKEEQEEEQEEEITIKPKKLKSKKQKEEKPIIKKTYDTMTEDEKRDIIEAHLKKTKEKGYRSTNPEDKDKLNDVFASNIANGVQGKVVFLDHLEFKTADALLEHGIRPEDMIIPQRAEHYDEMRKHEIYGQCIVLEEFNDTLHRLIREQVVIKGVYADYCSTFEKDGEPFINLMRIFTSNHLLTEHAVIGVTITQRNPEGVRFAGQDITKMEKMICRAFPNNINLLFKHGVTNDDEAYTYGNGAPMATWMFSI